MILWVRNLDRMQMGSSSAPCGFGWGHSLGSVWLAPGLGWRVQEGFTHLSSILVLFHIPSLSSRVTVWASWKHGGLRVVGLHIWQQASKRDKVEVASSLKILGSTFPPRKQPECCLCCILLVRATHKASPDSGGRREEELPTEGCNSMCLWVSGGHLRRSSITSTKWLKIM